MNYLALTGADLDAINPPGFNYAGTGIGPLVTNVAIYIIYFAGFALTIYIVLAGFAILTSKGDEKAVAAAKAKLTYGVTGFLIIFTAYWVVQIVGKILGITIIETIFK
jgi:hypothetical protein